MRVISLSLVLFQVLALTVLAARKPTKTKVTPTTWSLQSEVFDEFVQPGVSYNCTLNVTVNAAFSTCSDGSPVAFVSPMILRTPPRQRDWLRLCTDQCLQNNLDAPSAFNRCVGVVRRKVNQCVMAECPRTTTLVTASPTKSPRPPPPVTAQLMQNCYVQRPTNSPTTAAPTKRPTRPTGAPIPACSVEGPHRAMFQSLEGGDPRLSEYTPVVTNRRLCEYIRPRNFLPSGISIVTNFGCTLAACVRWCTYDSLCTFSMYSAKLQTCYKANNLEMLDDEREFQQYYVDEWQVLRKNTVTDIMYFAGKCNWLVPTACNVDKECGWNKGRRGYNDPIQGGGAGGWCGRIRCYAGEV